MNWFLVALGAWIVFDGVFSIIIYSGQSLPEHLVRIIRACVGVAVIIYAGYGRFKRLWHSRP